MTKPARLYRHELRFHARDGWTLGEVEALLELGSIQYFQEAFRLKHTSEISALNYERLDHHVSDVIDRSGYILSTRERADALKYYSTQGIYIFGDFTPNRSRWV